MKAEAKTLHKPQCAEVPTEKKIENANRCERGLCKFLATDRRRTEPEIFIESGVS